MISDPDDGVIKYKLTLKMTPALAADDYLDLEKWRAILYRMGLVGEYPSTNIGFGNLSKKILGQTGAFIITGSQTGRYPNLNGGQYTKVLKCSIERATIEAMGPIAPSSESMTHYSIYQSCPQVNYVFHIHHRPMWDYLCAQKGMSTSSEAKYGTSEMAISVKQLIQNRKSGILAMAGHMEGIIAWGESSEQAGKLILDTLKLLPRPDAQA